VGVYTQKSPVEAPLLMKYSEITRDLAARGRCRSIPVSTVLRKSLRIFIKKKKIIDMYIFLIKVNCKLNLENSFDIYFLSILFCQLLGIDKGHRHVLAAKFYSWKIISLPTAVTPSHHRRKASSKENGTCKYIV